jgi:hypothetical protein
MREAEVGYPPASSEIPISPMTPIFQPVPSLMLVGVDGDLADECSRAFPEFLVLRVGHAAAAVERMLVTRPLVVVLGDVAPAEDAELVVACARDICAEVLPASTLPAEGRVAFIRASALMAEQNRDRPTSPPDDESFRIE